MTSRLRSRCNFMVHTGYHAQYTWNFDMKLALDVVVATVDSLGITARRCGLSEAVHPDFSPSPAGDESTISHDSTRDGC